MSITAMDATAVESTPVTVKARSATRRLLTAELRLLVRDPLTLTFVLVFPIVTMLIIGGSFGTEPDEVFPVNPAHWYVASYFTVVIGATGLIMLPVHIASYRERGVLRRFAAAGFPRWSFAFAQLAMGLTAILVSGAALLAVAAPVYGVPAIDDPLRVAAGVVVGSVAFVSIGVLLGTVLPSARSAQAVGLLLFFPSFLLGVGGPPPVVMSPTLGEIAGKLPLALANQAIREPWLGLGTATGALVTVTVIAIVATALAARRAAL
jgi:ABC-2 type transport system permease protein